MANRGGELLDQFTVDDWQHVKDTMNPTDSGPRAVTVSQLLESELFDGPAWLRQHPGSWPDQVKLVDIYDIALMTTPTESVIDWSRFSKYKQKVEVIVHCLRLRSKPRGEIWRKNAERLILQMPQRESFAELFSKNENNSGAKVKHELAKFSPFDDSDNTIRLKGRLTISVDLKHPILLSGKQHPAVTLMLIQTHEDNHHQGTEYLRSLVQQRFWVIGLRNALRSIKSKCAKLQKTRSAINATSHGGFTERTSGG